MAVRVRDLLVVMSVVLLTQLSATRADSAQATAVPDSGVGVGGDVSSSGGVSSGVTGGPVGGSGVTGGPVGGSGETVGPVRGSGITGGPVGSSGVTGGSVGSSGVTGGPVGSSVEAAQVVDFLNRLAQPMSHVTRWLERQASRIKQLPPWGSTGGIRGALFELGVVDIVSVADWAGLIGLVDFSEYRIFATPPVIGPRSSSFGWRHHPVLKRRKLHKGVDFRARSGTRVRASAPGRVIYAARMGTYGNLVKIDHGQGLETRYAHLRRIKVRKGDYVAAGTLVGLVGATGRVTGPHLHFEVRLNNEPVDPATTFIVPLFNKRRRGK